MQILGLLGIYFDAVVVEFKTFYTFMQIGSGYTVCSNILDVRNLREQVLKAFCSKNCSYPALHCTALLE